MFIKRRLLFKELSDASFWQPDCPVTLGMIFADITDRLNDLLPNTGVMVRINSKITALAVLLSVASACSMLDKPSSLIEEDKLFMTRVYIGNFIDYRHTASDDNGNPDLIWITTTRDSIHGKISAYGMECLFNPGERLYISRVLSSNGKSQAWKYRIENSDTIRYMINEYHNHRKDLVGTWLNTMPDNQQLPGSGSPQK